MYIYSTVYIVIIYIRLAAPLLFLCTNICLNRGTTISFQCLKHFLKKNLTEELWLCCGARGWLTVWHKYGEKVPVKPGTVEDADICCLALDFEFAMQLFANAWSHQHLRTDLSSGCQYPGILGMGTTFQLLAAVICHSNIFQWPKVTAQKNSGSTCPCVHTNPQGPSSSFVSTPWLFSHEMNWNRTHSHGKHSNSSSVLSKERQISNALAPPRSLAAPSMNSKRVICPSPLSFRCQCSNMQQRGKQMVPNISKYHIAPSNFRVRQV